MKKLVNNFLYEKESYLIIEAAREVWRELGGSFKENIADKAFNIALKKRNLKIENQKRINIYFADQIVGVYVPDMIINEVILVEIKCKPFLIKEDYQQLWHYLKATKFKLGFIINFSPRGVQFKRIVYDTARNKAGLA
ncbi:GxxExxY protein [Patescibacteria group bacterium]|nr:GxxExxY protein [Patescibacteria group bacterium]MBU4347472.1 GxxExxY protein [Patescibacteria group bacterium]MBU4455398.1 GxxExxY protein [Patescibacteria group bacterium]MCG2690589.1 GxxExxY protein [Candidatus Parcubacteria bacterium]